MEKRGPCFKFPWKLEHPDLMYVANSGLINVSTYSQMYYEMLLFFSEGFDHVL